LELAGKRVLVVGMARSGVAASELLSKMGAIVKVSDNRPMDQLKKEIRTLEGLGVALETGAHCLDSFLAASLIVVSPGVPLRIPELQEAQRAGIEIISELELAFRFLKGKIIAITGTNGKTTTTALVGEIMKTTILPVLVGGNIGTPLSSLVGSSTPETFSVVEVSSFQLEAAPSFRPDVAVILNVTPDHIDRHGDFRGYVETKLNILRNQLASDMAVLNLEDPILSGLNQSVRAKTFWFSNRREVEDGTGFDGEQLVFKKRGNREVIVPGRSVLLRGSHNLENVAAAVTASRLAGVSATGINGAISRFKGVEHRLEWVAEIEGVSFYNDSKATNVDATIKALLAFDSGLVLILGGRDKGGDYTVLRPLVRQRVKTILLLGEASGKIQSQLEGIVPMHRVKSMQEAVNIGFKLADRGETVLLAPACASFDMFLDYEDRGQAFKGAVNSLRVVNAMGVNEI